MQRPEPIVGKQTYLEYQQPNIRQSVREPIFVCRDCGRDVQGQHESMKCFHCRTSADCWSDDYAGCY